MSSSNQNLEETFKKATSLRDAGAATEALAILSDLSARYPDTLGVWLVLGGIQMSHEDYASAERSFAAATALKPRSELASIGRFHALNRLGRADDAFAEMRRFLALRPESREYARLIAEIEDS